MRELLEIAGDYSTSTSLRESVLPTALDTAD